MAVTKEQAEIVERIMYYYKLVCSKSIFFDIRRDTL